MLPPVVIAIALAASSGAENTVPSRPLTAAEKVVIEHAVKAKLSDPDSAEFKLGADRPPAGTIYCGLVNAKNAYGGYVGFSVFSVFAERDPKSHRITSTVGPASLLSSDGDYLSSITNKIIVNSCQKSGFMIDY